MKNWTNANKLKLGIAVVVTALLITFIIQNMQLIEVKVLFATVEIRRSLMILFTLGVGALLGWSLRSLRSA